MKDKYYYEFILDNKLFYDFIDSEEAAHKEVERVGGLLSILAEKIEGKWYMLWGDVCHLLDSGIIPESDIGDLERFP
jgi:hypothetical protein